MRNSPSTGRLVSRSAPARALQARRQRLIKLRAATGIVVESLESRAYFAAGLVVEQFRGNINPMWAADSVGVDSSINFASSINPIAGDSTPFHIRWTGTLTPA